MTIDVFDLTPMDPAQLLFSMFAAGPVIFGFFWAMDLMARKEGLKLMIMAAAAIAAFHYCRGWQLPVY